jgi:hypothetical protein
MNPTHLDTLQALYMLGWLSSYVERGVDITPELWAEAMQVAEEFELRR